MGSAHRSARPRVACLAVGTLKPADGIQRECAKAGEASGRRRGAQCGAQAWLAWPRCAGSRAATWSAEGVGEAMDKAATTELGKYQVLFEMAACVIGGCCTDAVMDEAARRGTKRNKFRIMAAFVIGGSDSDERM
uniref:Uncharacterized protein n=1 Tax=Alexandrium catenella TaxID=2925 RepID=A0A7S1PP44_ALECA|mmetsp:Transcript_105620/g.281326  ORF Transcript_105620/g.281326 Transcript_105620/m.281326 type:complete len:135 (+) Transcript_105620:67-471(+)